MTCPFFYLIMTILFCESMEKNRLKLIVKNLELLVESLKTEIYADKESYLHHSVDEKYKYGEQYDDDGDPD